ncbi:hypothetical protein [Mycolicibacterium sp.]|uniref:hypothetical protein n=1 Tax=Mycolicibacterium sp. TaxID=2320850 RepID=UPI0037C71175
MADVAVDLVRSVLGLETVHRQGRSYTEHFFISRAAAHYMLLVPEFELMRWGELIGYYPEGTSEKISAIVKENGPPSAVRGAASHSLAEIVDHVGEDLWAPQNTLEHELIDRKKFRTLEAIWLDSVTPELTECIRLVLFTEEREWEQEIAQVKQLADRLHRNPSLNLSGEELDRVAWALSGAAPLFDEDSLSWAAIRNAFDYPLSSDRPRQLEQVRSEIEELRDVLTDDGSSAAAAASVRRAADQTGSIAQEREKRSTS